VLGISKDSPKALKKFKDKYSLPYSMLGDEDKKLCEAFSILKEKTMYGRTAIGIERTSFLIDTQGRVAKIFPKVKPEGHAEEVLAAIKEHSKS